MTKSSKGPQMGKVSLPQGTHRRVAAFRVDVASIRPKSPRNVMRKDRRMERAGCIHQSEKSWHLRSGLAPDDMTLLSNSLYQNQNQSNMTLPIRCRTSAVCEGVKPTTPGHPVASRNCIE